MRHSIWYICLVLGLCVFAQSTLAQNNVPASADVGRVDENLKQAPKIRPEYRLPQIRTKQKGAQAPANAESIKVVLRALDVDGVTAFTPKQIKEVYAPYIGQEIPMSKIWEIASEITALYQNKGYFLSRAYVPEQAVEAGFVVIHVVEGYVSRLEYDGPYKNHKILQDAHAEIKRHIPLRRQDLERFLLTLNDLGGVAFDALLKPEHDVNRHLEGAVVLHLDGKATKPRLQASLDNYGSQFLGPLQANTSIQAALIPFHETIVSIAHSIPADELKNVSVTHKAPLKQGVRAVLSTGVTSTKPGKSLEANNVEGVSTFYGLGLEYDVLRERQKNLAIKADLDIRNSKTDILTGVLVDDKIRSVSLTADGDFFSKSGGYSDYMFSLSKGVDVLGGSDEGDANLSRSGAEPNFTKLKANYLWQKALPRDFMLQFQVEGQWSGDSLVSSEEFGFGGPRLGRAFDASEISGDSGFGTGLELHYMGLPNFKNIRTMPYAFYDIGRVWNHEAGRGSETASSTGLGLRLMYETSSKARIYADVYAAQPVINHPDNPLIGNGDAPRVGFRLGVLN